MEMKQNQYKLPSSLRSISIIGVLLVACAQIPLAHADEETIESLDALESAMLRNQMSFNQQLSALNDNMLNEYTSRVSIKLEQETEQKWHEIELANEKYRIELEEYAENKITYLPPAGVNINLMERLAVNNIGAR